MTAGSSFESRTGVTAPELTDLGANTGASLSVTGLQAGALTVSASTGGAVRASGRAGTLTVKASTGGEIDAGGLEAKEVALALSTGATATVKASEAIRGSTATGGRARVRGKPKQREVEGSGFDYQ